MKKAITFISFLLIILFAACKKDNTEPITDTPPANLVDGYFWKVHMQFIEADTLQDFAYEMGKAWFPGPNNTGFVTVDSVSLNNTYLKFNSTTGEYDSDTIVSHGNKWHVKGNNGIPNLDYTNTMAMPAYSGYKSLVDSVGRNRNLTISLIGISHTGYGYISLSDNLGNGIIQNFDVASSSVSFKVSELSTLQATTFAYIHIMLLNENPQSIAGKTFVFRNEQMFNKQIVIY